MLAGVSSVAQPKFAPVIARDPKHKTAGVRRRDVTPHPRARNFPAQSVGRFKCRQQVAAAGVVRIVGVRRKSLTAVAADTGPSIGANTEPLGSLKANSAQLDPAGRARIRDPGDFQTVAPERSRIREGEGDLLRATAERLIGARVQHGQITRRVHAVNAPVVGIGSRASLAEVMRTDLPHEFPPRDRPIESN